MQQEITKINGKIRKQEQLLIGGLISFPEKIPSVVTMIDEMTAFKKEYRLIKQSFIEKKDLAELLEDGGLSLYELCNVEPKIPSKPMVEKLINLYRKERLIKILLETQDKIGAETDEILEGLQEKLIKLYKGEELNGAEDILKEIEKEQENYAVKYSEGMEMLGISTGFRELDGITEGIRRGHFWVVGAYTSSGKTFFSLNIANNFLNQGKRVVFFSLEQSKSEILQRLMAISLGITPQKLIKGYMDNDLYDRIQVERERVKKLPFSIYDKAFKVETIKSIIRSEQIRKPLDLVIVDYLQNISGEKNEYELMTDVSRDLFETAKTLEIPILSLSQMSNESVRSKSNIIGFKGSGGIAASSDVAVEMAKNENEVLFSIRKNRHGITGSFTLNFLDGRFSEKSIYEKK